MKQFVKDNLAIVAAIVLPLVLVSCSRCRASSTAWWPTRSTTSSSPPTSTAVERGVLLRRRPEPAEDLLRLSRQVNGNLPERQHLADVARAGAVDDRGGDRPRAAAARRGPLTARGFPSRSRVSATSRPQLRSRPRWLRVPAVVRLLQQQHDAGCSDRRQRGGQGQRHRQGGRAVPVRNLGGTRTTPTTHASSAGSPKTDDR